MKNGLINKLTVPILLFASLACHAQDPPEQTRKEGKKPKMYGRTQQAKYNYDRYSYIDIRETLLNIVDKGQVTQEILGMLGDSYYFNNEMKEARKWYSELMKMDSIEDPEYYFRYAQSLKVDEQYEEADKWMQRLKEAKGGDTRIGGFFPYDSYITDIEANSQIFTVESLDINSEFSDFGAADRDGSLVFASTRNDGRKRKYNWNEDPYLNLYEAVRPSKDYDGFKDVRKLMGEVEKRNHESSAAFTRTGDTMYFTRNDKSFKFGRDNDKTINLHIYRAVLEEGEWTDVTMLPFNSDDYNVSHPALSPDGKKLYFASNMPGTHGGSDIYFVNILPKGEFGVPTNLGPIVNTPGRETFPYVSSLGHLYFASDGHPGLGGLDIFVYWNVSDVLNVRPSTEEFYNMGKPINSPYDDFALLIYEGQREGFFSSNRPGGKGDDDIYSFKWVCDQTISGIVVDRDSGEPIPDATVSIGRDRGHSDSIVTQESATFGFEADCDITYVVRVEKEGYSTDAKEVYVPEDDTKIYVVLIIAKEEETMLFSGDMEDFAEFMDLAPIYFDLDKSDVKPSEKAELRRIFELLKKYPNLGLEIKGHADSRGSKAYNQKLSERRYKAARDYVIEVGGIDPSRVSGAGYGEDGLVNRCEDGISCSEEEHQANRRTEFVIVENE